MGGNFSQGTHPRQTCVSDGETQRHQSPGNLRTASSTRPERSLRTFPTPNTSLAAAYVQQDTCLSVSDGLGFLYTWLHLLQHVPSLGPPPFNESWRHPWTVTADLSRQTFRPLRFLGAESHRDDFKHLIEFEASSKTMKTVPQRSHGVVLHNSEGSTMTEIVALNEALISRESFHEMELRSPPRIIYLSIAQVLEAGVQPEGAGQADSGVYILDEEEVEYSSFAKSNVHDTEEWYLSDCTATKLTENAVEGLSDVNCAEESPWVWDRAAQRFYHRDLPSDDPWYYYPDEFA